MHCESSILKAGTLASYRRRAGGISPRRLGTGALFVLLALGAAACSDDAADTCPRGRGIAAVTALDTTRVKLSYACRVDATSAADITHYSAKNLTVQPEEILALRDASTEGASDVILTTEVQEAGVTYTLRVDGVKDAAGNTILATANFTGSGKAKTAPVTFRFDDSTKAQAKAVTLLLSVNPETGTFSPGKNTFALADKDGDHVWEGSLNVAVDPLRTAKTDDDGQGPEHLGYTARAVDGSAQALSELAIFEVLEVKAKTVTLVPVGGVQPPPPGGTVMVTFKVDDRPAKVLEAPALEASFTDKGVFDATFPTMVKLTDDDGDHVWEGQAPVQVDGRRVLSGIDPETLPYSVVLNEGGKSRPGRSAVFAVTKKDQPITVNILVGAKDKVPVTFRVDVSQAWLDPKGQKKGLYAGEAVFLTGEFGKAEDAFGANASDAFSGGENVVLQMRERQDHPGVWERTIFLPKNRPYGWKAVRCPKDEGCTKLNKMVLSSGRAFPTVMKNLVTELCDAGRSSWSDANCTSPKVIDPRNLAQVDTGTGSLDYTSATIFEGTGGGIKDQKDPSGTPMATQMFKQESPDLVAIVKDAPLETKVYVVGTWRDVNIPGSPKEIVATGKVVDLNETDYDSGFIGASPPSYTLSGIQPPPPITFTLDGVLDSSAKQVAGTASTLKLYAAFSGGKLYIATDDAGEGSDHFILLSATGTGATRPAPWGKTGTVAFAGKALFVADENDNGYAGIYELDPDKALADNATSTAELGVATSTNNGGVVEAVINLAQVFGSVPKTIWIAAGPWATAAKGALYPSAAVPPSKDNDGNIDANEILSLSLPGLTVNP